MLFEFLVGPQKLFSEFIKEIGINNGSVNKAEAVKVARKVLNDIGVSKEMVQLIEGCLMYEESDRFAWKDIFDHQIFQKSNGIKPNGTGAPNKERSIVPAKKEPIINKLRITPDTTTLAWSRKLYRQDNANKNVCIYQVHGNSEWLCSSDLPCDDEFAFTIKVHKVTT